MDFSVNRPQRDWNKEKFEIFFFFLCVVSTRTKIFHSFGWGTEKKKIFFLLNSVVVVCAGNVIIFFFVLRIDSADFSEIKFIQKERKNGKKFRIAERITYQFD